MVIIILFYRDYNYVICIIRRDVSVVNLTNFDEQKCRVAPLIKLNQKTLSCIVKRYNFYQLIINTNTIIFIIIPILVIFCNCSTLYNISDR